MADAKARQKQKAATRLSSSHARVIAPEISDAGCGDEASRERLLGLVHVQATVAAEGGMKRNAAAKMEE
jgi:hypothetical protein